MGHSVGRWEGETLVVEVTELIDQTWLDRSGNFHSGALTVTERYTPVTPYHIEYEATITDAEVFTEPWTIKLPLYLPREDDVFPSRRGRALRRSGPATAGSCFIGTATRCGWWRWRPGLTSSRGAPTCYSRHNLEGNGNPNYDVSLDSQQFLMVRGEADETPELNVVLNWHQELLERVPIP